MHHVTVNPNQCGRRHCIRGLRIRVKDMLDLLVAGVSIDEILSDFNYLEPEYIISALGYAARQSDHLVLRAA